MKRLKMLPLVLLLALPSVGESQSPGTHWEGVLRFRGADLPIRLHRFDRSDSTTVTLDIPTLLMAGEPIESKRSGQRLTVVLPFGLDTLELQERADTLTGHKVIGDDTLTALLHRGVSPPYTEHQVTFENDGARFVGAVLMPGGPGAHPGVVLLHGSSQHDRSSWAYRSWGDLLAREGFAVLMYDKRGGGGSGGAANAGLRQLAGDAGAAWAHLRSHAGVDSTRVGLKAGSQGAWLAEQVALDHREVAFMILTSAAAGTPAEQERQMIEYGMRDDGMPDDDIQSALAYAGLYFYVVRTGEGWPLLVYASRAASAAPWGQYVDQPTSLESLQWWKENHDFHPGARLNEIGLPALLLYGGADWIVPPMENALRLRSLFGDTTLVELHSFAGADHRLERPAFRDADGFWHWPSMPPHLFSVLHDWLDRVR